MRVDRRHPSRASPTSHNHSNSKQLSLLAFGASFKHFGESFSASYLISTISLHRALLTTTGASAESSHSKLLLSCGLSHLLPRPSAILASSAPSSFVATAELHARACQLRPISPNPLLAPSLVRHHGNATLFGMCPASGVNHAETPIAHHCTAIRFILLCTLRCLLPAATLPALPDNGEYVRCLCTTPPS